MISAMYFSEDDFFSPALFQPDKKRLVTVIVFDSMPEKDKKLSRRGENTRASIE